MHGIERLGVRSIAKGVSLSSNPNKSKFVKGTIFALYEPMIIPSYWWGLGGGSMGFCEKIGILLTCPRNPIKIPNLAEKVSKYGCGIVHL